MPLDDTLQDIPEVMAPPAELNPATWILQATTLGVEQRLGIDFADVYMASTSYRQDEKALDPHSSPIAHSDQTFY